MTFENSHIKEKESIVKYFRDLTQIRIEPS